MMFLHRLSLLFLFEMPPRASRAVLKSVTKAGFAAVFLLFLLDFCGPN